MATRKPASGVTNVARWEPPFHAAIPRQGEPGREYASTDARGITRSIRADASGIVWPTTPEDVRLIDTLPVAADWRAPEKPALDKTVPDAPVEPEQE